MTKTSPAASTDRPRLDWGDALAVLVLSVGGVLAARHFAAAIGPTVTMIGPDSTTYLQNILAVATRSWEAYNGDKRELHAILGARLGGAMGGDYLGASRLLSIGAIGSLPALTYLTGRAAFGRAASLGGAVLVLAQPELWACTIDTSNYALFNGMIACFVAAAAWAVARPHALTWGLAGGLASLCAATQEKTLLVVLPAAALAGFALRRLPPSRLHWRRLLLPLAAALAAWGTARAVEIPVQMTTFANLVVNVRGDVHRNTPHAWPVLHTRPRESPSPLSPLLPGTEAGRAVEAIAAAVLTRPDADVWRLTHFSRKTTWVLAAGTSIPPDRVRWARTWASVSDRAGRWAAPRAGLLAFGVFSLLLWRPSGLRRERLAGCLIASVLISTLPTLNVNYVRRYLEHVLPAVALLQVAGLEWAIALLPAPARVRGWLAGGLVLAAAVAGAFAIATDDPEHPGRTKSVAAKLEALHAQQLGDGSALAMTEAARWLADAPAPRVLHCGSTSMGLLLPGDARIQAVHPSGCLAAAESAQAAGTLLVISERGGPGSPSTSASVGRDPRWAHVHTFAPRRPQGETIDVFRAR